MKIGTPCKNLADAFVLIMAFVALVSLIVGFVSFDGEYIIDHPTTGDEITVSSFLDDPYMVNFLLIGAAFALTAIIGFTCRRKPVVSLAASIALLALVLIKYDDRLLTQKDFAYIIFAFLGLAGSITYTVCYYAEKAGLIKSENE